MVRSELLSRYQPVAEHSCDSERKTTLRLNWSYSILSEAFEY